MMQVLCARRIANKRHQNRKSVQLHTDVLKISTVYVLVTPHYSAKCNIKLMHNVHLSIITIPY
jgi:hypothetical protein